MLMQEHVEKPFHQISNGARNRMKPYLQDPGAKVTSGRAEGRKPAFHIAMLCISRHSDFYR